MAIKKIMVRIMQLAIFFIRKIATMMTKRPMMYEMKESFM